MARPSSYWRHDLKVYWHSLRLQVRAAMSLRGAFVLEIMGMILNNIAIIVAWFFLFHQFGSINGWGVRELIGFMGLNMLIFGIVMILSVGVLDLPRHVDRGSLDSMFTKPQPVLQQLAVSNIDATVFGDLLLGLILTGWYAFSSNLAPAKLAVFMLAILTGLIIFWCLVVVLPSLLAFYVFDSAQLSRSVGMATLDTGIYPTGVLTGGLRTVLLTAVPGLFMGAVQLEVLHKFSWQAALLGIPVAAFWLALTLWLFRRSILRYESSNLVGAR